MKRSSLRRFAYQLAVKLGRVNVSQMLRSLTAKQFLEWQAYARIEPFNELRDDYRAASIVAMIFNMAVDRKDRKPITDFLLKWEETETPKKQTWQEQQAVARIIVAAYSAPGIDE